MVGPLPEESLAPGGASEGIPGGGAPWPSTLRAAVVASPAHVRSTKHNGVELDQMARTVPPVPQSTYTHKEHMTWMAGCPYPHHKLLRGLRLSMVSTLTRGL